MREARDVNPSLEFDEMFKLSKPYDIPNGETPSAAKKSPLAASKSTKH